ncbi:carbohydrate ABC transporter substrate-binding protein, CUT1 family (TC 3.A.1.1.-) [Aureimonas altamirensis DSM 21988]|jgi:raffinose/stachyose/melibiose transport system substrate-binding protein|uniref:Probable sugar-binding periplasmic protein n=2 Tax=Aureimonas altamirensis TaxID=370622 RepID=A0A0P0YWW5_9HYPH|nr:ABC transporter substrate-binding protein [Aureimonas altamirensis]BAT26005.1 sugar ABC transporter periplasmic sugar-binding protein [Aureimonas altamirensis]SHI78418.1 carbohydrate ABC transporter substrate-binding protein, CUT1 family (TC 3.A.1.1.-) [Aureimonas altamirensis DSM 21988]
MSRPVLKASISLAALGLAGPALAQTTLTIESWRNDDLPVWQEKIIPAFEAKHPDIKLVFSPSAPTEYNSALAAKLDAGSAGDIVACRPFDGSLQLFQNGKLGDLTDLPGMENFSAIAKTAWSTDDGSKTFCVPMASVLHGFMYNMDAFEQLGLEVPTTEAEFFAVLDKIKEDGTFVPLAIGTKDQWEAATMGYQNIGPTYWKGEDGRKKLIDGEEKLTDEPWVKPFEVLARWADYMGDGYQAQTYPDSQNLFTLGRAAIYPTGSWEISVFEPQVDFKMGAFKPPVVNAGDTCYVSDHPDIGMGVNAASPNQEAAKTFLEWVATSEFAEIYANAAPGFFPLIDADVTIEDPLAQSFVAWRGECQPTIRSTYQILSRGTPNLENETWAQSANVMNRTVTPTDAATTLQTGLDSWYKPGAAPAAPSGQ